MRQILSIDGGGIRGIIPASILAYIEESLIRKTGDPSLRIVDYFDLIAGTSTGGILATLYLSPKRYSATQIKEKYVGLGPKLFHKTLYQRITSGWGLFSARYSEESLCSFAQELLGDDYISDVAKDCIITSYDMTDRKALLFTKHNVDKYGDYANYKLCDIVRATSAAPSYFKPAKIYPKSSALLIESGVSTGREVPYRHLVDGGIYANNPAMCALVEAIKLWPQEGIDNFMMLSAGTGKVYRSYSYKKTKQFGLINWISPILDIMLSSVAETVDFQMMQVFGSLEAAKNYVRLEIPLGDAHVNMDKATHENIDKLLNAVESYIDQNQELLDSVINNLLTQNN